METRGEGEDDTVTPSLRPSSVARADKEKVKESVKCIEDVTSAELYGHSKLSKNPVFVDDDGKTTRKTPQRLAT